MEEEDGEGEVQASLRREVNMKEAEKKYVSSRGRGKGGRGKEVAILAEFFSTTGQPH